MSIIKPWSNVRPFQSSPAHINSPSYPRLDPIDSKSSYIYFVSYLSGKPGSWLPSGLMWVVVFPPMRYVPWSESGVHETCPSLPTSRVRCSSQVPVSGLHCRQLCFSVLLGPAPAISNPVKKWMKILRNIWNKKFELIDTTSTEQMVV